MYTRSRNDPSFRTKDLFSLQRKTAEKGDPLIHQKLKFFFTETLNNIWQFRTRNIFSITIICLSFLILGIFLSLSNNLQYTAQQISKNLVLVVFLNKDITEVERNTVALELGKSPQIEKTRFVSAEEAMEKFLEKFPELQAIVENLKVNPFPPSYEVTLREDDPSATQAHQVIEDIQNIPGVEDIQYNKEWVERMQSLSRLAKAVGFFLGGILILASFFIISNVVKLNVFARKEELGILRLVGGTNTFIRIPFLLEGIVLGMLGGALSLLLLFIIIKLFPLYLGSSLGVVSQLISFRSLTFSQCILLTASGAAIGFLGSYSSLAKFLKV